MFVFRWIIFAVVCLRSSVLATAACATVSDDIAAKLEKSNFMVNLYQYENPINRDHFIYTGKNTEFNFSDFKFNDYRFDGYVTTVLSKEGYEYLKTIAPECLPRVLPVYHGYHEDMKHNYFSKPWEPYFEGPVFYCSRQKGLLGADLPIWTLDGQPHDVNGNLGYDTIYTTHLVEKDLPIYEDYVMYRVLCNSWPHSFSHHDRDEDFFAHKITDQFAKLFQFYNEYDQDHYYATVYKNTTEDRANFQNVVGVIIDPVKYPDAGIDGCKKDKDLVKLIQAYDVLGTNHMIFVGDEKMAESKMMFLPVNVVTLGYVARRKNDACNARYQLNIRVRLNHDDLSKGPTDKDVYIAPNAYSTIDDMFLDQTFYIW